MNRLYAFKNLVNIGQNNKYLFSQIDLFSSSYQYANLLQKNKHFVSNLFDHLQEENLQEQTKTKTSRQQKNNNKPKTVKKQSSKDVDLSMYSQNLKNLAKQFSQQASFYVAPLQHSKTFHYASYFLPTVRILHSRKLIKDEKLLTNVFRHVKNTIKPTEQKIFTPQSVVRIMQQFSTIDFDGDESICLNVMLEYARQNFIYFTQIQWQRFKAAYKDIMVNKALGPVKFKPLMIEKNYQSDAQRKILVIKQNLKKFFNIADQDIDKQIIINQKYDKKWVVIKVPSKKLTIFTYPSSLSLQNEEAYSYIYDVKQSINTIVRKTLRQKNRLLFEKLKINIQIRQFLQTNQNNNFQYLIQRGLVYRQKKQIVDELQKYEEMKKMSLKEQIEKMKEKKRQLKQRQKFKEKQKNIENPAKLQNKNKQFDFFQTLKYSIKQIQQETLEKLNKRKTPNEIPKKKKKKAAKLQKQMQNEEEFEEDEDEQIEQEDQRQEEHQQEKKIQMNPAMIEKMKLDLQTFSKRVAQKQQKAQLTKKQKPQISQIQSFIKVQNQKITIQKILNKVLSNSSLQSVKEFTAYVSMIETFQNAMDEINKFQRVKDYSKKVQQSRKSDSQKGIISEKRFKMIRDELNEPLDTIVELNTNLDEIFSNPVKQSQQQDSKGNKKPNESQDFLQHSIVIMSEQQLLNSITATLKKQIMRSNKVNVNKKIQKQDSSSIQLKEQIFKQAFFTK